MKYIIIILWTLSVVLAYFFGLSQRSETLGPTDTSTLQSSQVPHDIAGHSKQPPLYSNKTNQYESEAPAGSNRQDAELNHDAWDAETAKQTIDALNLNLQSFDLRSLSITYDIVSALNDTEFMSLLESYLPLGEDNQQTQVFGLLLLSYAEKQPQRALNLALDHSPEGITKTLFLGQVLGKWAEQDTNAALSWYTSNPEQFAGPMGGLGFSKIVSVIARDDIGRASDLVIDNMLQSQDFNTGLGSIIQHVNSASDFDLVFSKLNEMDERALPQSSAVRTMAMFKPDLAVDWVENKSEEYDVDQGALRDDIFGTWQSRDFVEAANWRLQSAPLEERQAVLEKISKEYSHGENSQKRFVWLEQQTDLDITSARINMIGGMAFSAPDVASEHLKKVQDPEEKLDLSYRIYSGYERISPRRAEDFLTSSDIKTKLEARIKSAKEFEAQR
ncbi:hypothetical protein PN836_014710 [Ningiella sp. W23]|uniref:hypothetical protein n=1 Tax=Ningiella sp. W23 TaxID=3023715 RepID=UPI003757FF98